MKSPWSYFLLNVPKLSVYLNLRESIRHGNSTRAYTSLRDSTRVRSNPMESRRESHSLHSHLLKYIRVYRIICHLLEYSSYSKSSTIFINYKKLSNIIGSIQEWKAPRIKQMFERFIQTFSNQKFYWVN